MAETRWASSPATGVVREKEPHNAGSSGIKAQPPGDMRDFANPLRKAMQAVDLRGELEELGDPLPPGSGHPHRPVSSRISSNLPWHTSPPLEEMLEAELSTSFLESSGSTGNSPDNAEDTMLADLATHELARTCRDIVDDARTDQLMKQIREKRMEAEALVKHRSERQREEQQWQSDQQSLEREFLEPPEARTFREAFTARRLAFAVSVAALLAGGTYAYQADYLPVPHAGNTQPSIAVVAKPEVVSARAAASAPPIHAALSQEPEPGKIEERLAVVREIPQAPQTRDALVLKLEMLQEKARSATSPEAVDPAGEAAAADRVEIALLKRSLAEMVRNSANRVGSTPVAVATGTPEVPASSGTNEPVALSALADPQTVIPRDPAIVEAALNSSMGLEALAPAARNRLRDRLIAGECLTATLTDAFGQVPVLAMRDLVIKLDSGC
ncbi:MAG: hypothetical protein WBO55_02950 [Rhizobiaceae bacterium]